MGEKGVNLNPYKVKAGVEEERENCALGGRRL